MSHQDEVARHHAPDLYRPLIDAELLRLVELAGASREEALRALADLDASALDAWHYLQAAVRTLRPLIWHDRLRERLRGSWGFALFEPGDDVPFSCVETADELPPDDENLGVQPVVIERYPIEAHEALRQEHYWAGNSDGTVVGVVHDGSVARIYYAHPDRFELLGHDAVEFIQRVVAAVTD